MCKGLKNIKVPGRLKTIPKGCFQGTTACESIEIDEGIDSIMYNAFTLRNINTLILPSTLKYLDRYSIIGYSSSNGYISTLTSVYALMKEPCKLTDNEWGKSSYDPYVNTTLYVPIGCAEAYKAAGWGEYFKNIIEMDEESQRAAFTKSVTGVSTAVAPSKENAGYFNLQGQKLDTPQKGINILRTEDGKAKKVYVK